MEEWEIHERQFGSKCLLVSWFAYVTLIWVLKACMLFFYKRLTYVNPFIYIKLLHRTESG